MTKRVAISCENMQELDSIISVLLHEYNPDSIVIFNTLELYNSGLTEKIYRGCKVIEVKRIFKGIFRENHFSKRIIESIYVSLQLRKTMNSHHIKILAVGASLIYHRLAKLISGKKLHLVSFVRSVIVGADSYSATGRLKYIIPRLIGIPPYKADAHICTGPVTERFLKRIGAKQIYTVGPFDADSLISNTQPSISSFTKVVFMTSAYAWHGDKKGQTEQIRLANRLKTFLENKGIALEILLHPRDQSKLYEKNLKIIEGGLSTCLTLVKSEESVLFLSMASTLTFELAYLGFHSNLITTPDFFEENSNWYRLVKAKPILRIDDLMDSKPIHFLDAFSEEYKGHVTEKACKIFLDMELSLNA